MNWDVAEAAELYRQGWSLLRIAQFYGDNTRDVALALKLHGVQMRTPAEGKRIRLDRNTVELLFHSGCGTRRIAAALGYSTTPVVRVLRELGLSRPVGNIPKDTGRLRSMRRATLFGNWQDERADGQIAKALLR